MKTGKAGVRWFMGGIFLFMIIAVCTIAKKTGMETSSIMGIAVIMSASFIFLLWDPTRKHSHHVCFHDKKNIS
jgi:amino acid permease